jgi:hypothetical protein
VNSANSEKIKMINYEKISGQIFITTPYNTEFVSRIKKLGGKWNANKKNWEIAEAKEPQLIDILNYVFAWRTAVYQVHLKTSEDMVGRQEPVVILGRVIAKATGRDSGAYWGKDDDVTVISGEAVSGGSAKNWVTKILGPVELIIRNVSKDFLDDTEKTEKWDKWEVSQMDAPAVVEIPKSEFNTDVKILISNKLKSHYPDFNIYKYFAENFGSFTFLNDDNPNQLFLNVYRNDGFSPLEMATHIKDTLKNDGFSPDFFQIKTEQPKTEKHLEIIRAEEKQRKEGRMNIIQITAAQLKKIIKDFASNDESRVSLTGIYVEDTENTDVVRLTATTGHILISFLVWRVSLENAISKSGGLCFSDEGYISNSDKENELPTKSRARTQKGTYPDWRKAIPDILYSSFHENSKFVNFDADLLKKGADITKSLWGIKAGFTPQYFGSFKTFSAAVFLPDESGENIVLIMPMRVEAPRNLEIKLDFPKYGVATLAGLKTRNVKKIYSDRQNLKNEIKSKSKNSGENEVEYLNKLLLEYATKADEEPKNKTWKNLFSATLAAKKELLKNPIYKKYAMEK